MKTPPNICPECGSVLLRSKTSGEAAVDAKSSVGDAASRDDKEARRTAQAAPGHGGDAGGALEEAASFLGRSDGPGGGLGTVAATAAQERRLHEWAEETGRLIPEASWLQHPLVCASSAENEVRFRAEDARAIKKTHAGTYGFVPRLEKDSWHQSPATPLEYLLRCRLQNHFFCDDIRLEGICVSSGPSFIIGQPAGGISIITSQSWIESADWNNPHPGEEEIAEWMSRLGFEAMPQTFYGWRHQASGIVLLDAKPDNFIRSPDGIVPIDLQMIRAMETASLLKAHESEPSPEASAAWHCPNPDCPAQVRKALVHWCAPGAMDIPGVDAAFSVQLTQRGLVRDVSELYQLTEDDLLQLEGMDREFARNFLAALEASKSRDMWRLIFGLGLPQVGVVEAQALARHFKDVEEVMGAPLDQLVNALGEQSETTAQNLVKWSKSSYNRKLIKRLRNAGLNFHSSP